MHLATLLAYGKRMEHSGDKQRLAGRPQLGSHEPASAGKRLYRSFPEDAQPEQPPPRRLEGSAFQPARRETKGAELAGKPRRLSASRGSGAALNNGVSW